MQDWASLIREIALLFSGLAAGLTAWNALREMSYEVSKDDKEGPRVDHDLYRNRWLESEKASDEIDIKNDRSYKKVRRLENTIDDFKERENKR